MGDLSKGTKNQSGATSRSARLRIQAGICPDQARNRNIVIFILTSHILYDPLISRASSMAVAPNAGRFQVVARAQKEGRRTMNNLDRLLEYLVVAVFVCVGCARIVSYRRRPKPLGAQRARLPFGLPYEWTIAVGVLEIAASLSLLMPFSFLRALVPIAVAFLALLTMSAAIYHARRHEPAIPNLALFLLVLLVSVGRWM
jgi:hypothetical protein